MSNLSIRQRMLLCLFALLIPLCTFVWMLVTEVEKTVSMTDKEIIGVEAQQPLVSLLVQLLTIQNQHAAGTVDQSALRQLAEPLKTFEGVYKQNAEAIGLGATPLSTDADAVLMEQTNATDWAAATAVVIDKIGTIQRGDAAALAEAGDMAEAVKALISRTSDGSGLTLDPDVDSYYLMDMVSFALPELFGHFATAERTLLHWTTARHDVNNHEEMTETLLARHALADDEGQRVLRSLNLVRSEDANYYGASPTLNRLDSLAAAYKADLKSITDILDAAVAESALPDKLAIKSASARAMDDALRLTQIGQEELQVLLRNRIDYYENYKLGLLLKGGAAVAAGLLLFFFVMRSISRPLSRVHQAMVLLAEGKIDVDVPYANQGDEIGQMAKALMVFKENAAFVSKVSIEFESSVIHAVEMVAAVAKEIDLAARDLTTQAGEGHVRLADLCKDIEAVSGGSREISAAGEQLKAAINEISAQVSVSAGTTAKAAEQAVHVRETALLLEQATEKISNVVTIISSITSKITLLALNATIESARAGEAGKGFAVVASEVKLLARQTEESTSEIAQAVAAIQQSSALTLSAIQSIGEIIKQLSEGSTVIAAAVEEQGAVADNIAQNMMASTGRLENVASNANALIDLTASSSAAATQSMQASIEFAGQFDKLRSEVKHFVGMMRGDDKDKSKAA